MADNVIKLLSTEAVCNATPSTSDSAKLVRVLNSSTGLRKLTVQELLTFPVTIDVTANATTLITLGSGNTEFLRAGYMVVLATNTAVINTNISAAISSIVNATALVVNADIIVANGTTNVSFQKSSREMTIPGPSEVFIVKGAMDVISSNNNSDVLSVAVAYRN